MAASMIKYEATLDPHPLLPAERGHRVTRAAHRGSHRATAMEVSVLAPRFTLVALAALGVLGLATEARPADEIHWTFTGQTSVAFDWRGHENKIRYGVTRSYGRTATAVTPNPLPFSSSGPFHEARLTGLAENTVYHYSIGKGPDHTFRTPPPRGSSGYTFYVEGDIGNRKTWSRVGDCQAMIAAGRPAFVLAIGDLTYGNALGQWAVDQHFNDAMVWSQDAAYMPAWGNHEYDDPEKDDLRNYKGRFDLPNPQSSPVVEKYPHAGGGEDWYWFDYGNVRFIAYPEPWSGAWKDWGRRVGPIMDEAEGDTLIDFIVTFGHQPAYSSGLHNGEAQLAGLMDALGARHRKYVLNLNGHSHNYERSHPQRGVVHVTAGIGGASLEETEKGPCLWHGGCPPPQWSAFRAMHHGAVMVRVTDGRIEGTVFCGPPGDRGENRNDVGCSPGSVMDSFTILPRSVAPEAESSIPATGSQPRAGP